MNHLAPNSLFIKYAHCPELLWAQREPGEGGPGGLLYSGRGMGTSVVSKNLKSHFGLGLLTPTLTPDRSSLYVAPWLSRILVEQQSNFPDSQYL